MVTFHENFRDGYGGIERDEGFRVKAVGKTIFGVDFTPEQWAAVELHPPLWHLHPPQREEYDSDYDYAIGEREYADRVIAAQKKRK